MYVSLIICFFPFQNKQEFCKIDLRKAVNISKIFMSIMKIYVYSYSVHAVSIKLFFYLETCRIQ